MRTPTTTDNNGIGTVLLRLLRMSYGSFGRPFTPEMSDAGFKRRALFAFSISIALNLVLFGAVGLSIHYILHAYRAKPENIVVTRIILPNWKEGDPLPARPVIEAAIDKANAAQKLAEKKANSHKTPVPSQSSTEAHKGH